MVAPRRGRNGRLATACLALLVLAGASAGGMGWFLGYRPWPRTDVALNPPVAPHRAPGLSEGDTRGVRRVRAYTGQDVDVTVANGDRLVIRSVRSPKVSVFFDVPEEGGGWVHYETGPSGRLDIHLHGKVQIVR